MLPRKLGHGWMGPLVESPPFKRINVVDLKFKVSAQLVIVTGPIRTKARLPSNALSLKKLKPILVYLCLDLEILDSEEVVMQVEVLERCIRIVISP